MRLPRYPRGLPWLGSRARKTALDANVFVDFSADVLRELFNEDPANIGMLTHPEDLGRHHIGTPASIWSWPAVKGLTDIDGVKWGACYQEDYGSKNLKPTRLLFRMPGAEHLVGLGGPTFDESGRCTGPLVWRDPILTLIGRDGNSFKTTAAATWPPKLCEEISKCIVAGARRLAEKRRSEVTGGDRR